MVPITKELRPVLVTLIKHSNSEFLFPNADGSQQTKYPRYLRDLCKTTKVKPFTFHAIRHFAATHASSKKAPIRGIQAMLGHEHIKTTSIYLQSLDETTKSVAETLISSPKKPVDNGQDFPRKTPKTRAKPHRITGRNIWKINNLRDSEGVYKSADAFSSRAP